MTPSIRTTANRPLIARVLATKRAIGTHRGLPDQPRVARAGGVR